MRFKNIFSALVTFMKTNTFIGLVLAVSAITLGFTYLQPWQKTDRGKDQVAKDILTQSLGRDHYLKLNVNDNFSQKAFDLYLERLDYNKRNLLSSDVISLKAYRDRIDDELSGQFGGLLELAQKIVKERTLEAQGYVNEILSKPFDFTLKETYETDPKKKVFLPTKEAIKEEWRKFLKYNALIQYQNRIETQNKSYEQSKKEGKEFEKKTQQQIEEDVRKQILKNYSDFFDRLIKRDEEDYRADLFNAVCLTYCPHTEYFAPIEKDNFDIDMSGKLEGIGATLQQTDGETKIVRVMPGSPSWKSKEVEAEDVILKVGQDKEEAVAISGMAMKDVLKLIRGKKGTKVRLTLRKKDGRLTEVSLVRDVIVLEESFVKSAVIEDNTTSKRYGYIFLPSFYADFGNSNGRFCSQDVAAEVEKLKNERVDGLILDLRNNGGGSLPDAIKMSGLFIENGPVVQVRDRSGRSYPYFDDDANVQYDGPLVVMVNKFSASASEILAAALQDYRRAVIIGTKSTFGKGTVQRFVDLDNYLPFNLRDYQPLGSLKLTIQKFYRISGGSTQLKGVEPDIVLPDPYNYIKSGEAEMPNVMPYDNVEPANFSPWNNFNIKEVVKTSAKRVKANQVFQAIEENALRIKKNREKTLVSLNYEEFIKDLEAREAEAKRFEGIKMQNNFFKFKAMEPVVVSQNTPEVQIELNERWFKELKEDAYIFEATRVLEDLKR